MDTFAHSFLLSASLLFACVLLKTRCWPVSWKVEVCSAVQSEATTTAPREEGWKVVVVKREEEDEEEEEDVFQPSNAC